MLSNPTAIPAGHVNPESLAPSAEARDWFDREHDREPLPKTYRLVGRAMAEAASRGCPSAYQRRHMRPGSGEVLCAAGRPHLARQAGVSVRTVQRALNEFHRRGLERRRSSFASLWAFPGTPVGTPVTPPVVPEDPRPSRPVRGADRTSVSQGRTAGRTKCSNRHRLRTCPECGHSWPADAGGACFRCDERRRFRERLASRGAGDSTAATCHHRLIAAEDGSFCCGKCGLWTDAEGARAWLEHVNGRRIRDDEWRRWYQGKRLGGWQ
ncbi:MAG: hypothetical protein OXG44_06230 [Gammaproteobacteria bacterium]|nr:hypothetical protein [Gammaproteobacteria bacterium]